MQQRSKKREQRIITQRGRILVFFCSILFLILFSRLFFLQMMSNEKFTDLKNSNVVKTNYITPERGDIFDRNGVKIAGSRGLFSLTVTPEKIHGFKKNRSQVSEEFVDEVANIIELTDKEKANLIKKLKRSPLFSEVVIKSDVSTEELSLITSNRKYLDSVSITSTKVRHYNNGGEYINLLGYVGKVSKDDLTDTSNFLTNLDFVGKKGIEKQKNDSLMGYHGQEVVGVNAYGRTISRKKVSDAVKGNGLSLTIDSEMQSLAYELLGEETGSIVMIDPNNGEVIAMASTPTYDPNKLIKGISKEEYKKVFLSKKTSPFFNRALSGQYPPASTVKPFVSIAALLGEWIDPNKKLWCGPYYQIKGSTRRFNDWKPQGHGFINMEQAIARSVDVYYYRVGQMMGIDYIHDVMDYFNFGKKTNINLAGENDGLLPSTKWKKKVKKESWYTGETLIASIGQGFMMSTPMQLAQSTAIMVNGGINYKPLLIKDTEPEVQGKIDIPEDITNIAKSGMREVIFGEYGTARKYKRNLVRYDQGGKTGTSQVYSTKGERPDKDVEMPKHLRDHALYIGFAPYENPEIVVSVVIENIGGGSTYAAPVGIKMMQAYLDKYHPDRLLEGKTILGGENDKEEK